MGGEDDFWGPVISKYTARDAVEDGIFVEVGSIGKDPVYFTSNLFESGGYKDRGKRIGFVNKGLDLLRIRPRRYGLHASPCDRKR